MAPFPVATTDVIVEERPERGTRVLSARASTCKKGREYKKDFARSVGAGHSTTPSRIAAFDKRPSNDIVKLRSRLEDYRYLNSKSPQYGLENACSWYLLAIPLLHDQVKTKFPPTSLRKIATKHDIFVSYFPHRAMYAVVEEEEGEDR
jgi:hypothetical protein